MTQLLAQPESKEQVLRYGFLPVENRSVDALIDYVKSETVRWSKVVHDAGIAGTQ
jgi:tripartite-type tricarboxylate transporter receptor subunit TctC